MMSLHYVRNSGLMHKNKSGEGPGKWGENAEGKSEKGDERVETSDSRAIARGEKMQK